MADTADAAIADAAIAIVSPTDAAATTSLFAIDFLSVKLGPEFAPMANDILRMFCIQMAVQLMMVMSSDRSESILSTQFLLLLLYVAIGVMLYWVAVRKLVVFV